MRPSRRAIRLKNGMATRHGTDAPTEDADDVRSEEVAWRQAEAHLADIELLALF